MRRTLKLLSIVTSLALASVAYAQTKFVERPTAGEIEKFKGDASYGERVARAKSHKTYKMSDALQQRAIYKIRRAALQASGVSNAVAGHALTSGPQMAFPYTAQPELRSSGTVKTLTILIDFKDFSLPNVPVSSFADNLYGTGTATGKTYAPFESLHNYYDRASQNKVNIQGNVLGWHHFPNDRISYMPAKADPGLPPEQRQQMQWVLDTKAIFKMASDAMDALHATNDYKQYDNDNDGDIDLVTIMYAGPDTGWGSFWWAYRSEFPDSVASTKTFDGKKLKQFVFGFVNTRGAANDDFDPTTLIHETGHAFGLADYYDYDDSYPTGGVGGLDMMDANQGNHCAFSRWLLDWIQPTAIGTGAPVNRTLIASGSTQTSNKAIAIFPGLNNLLAPNQELFLIENRYKIGNDEKMPGSGILVWHSEFDRQRFRK